MRKVIGIDIGGTNFRIGCVDEEGRVLCTEKLPSSIFRGNRPAMAMFAETIRDFMRRNQMEGAAAIAVGFPSPVSGEGVVYSCPNLKNPNGSFDGMNVKEFLQEEFHVPAFVMKDANFLLQAEISERKIESGRIVVGIYFGTGIGNSVYYAGDFITGKNGSGCDLGHIPVLYSDRVCNCGNVGCIECYASGSWLVELWKEKYPEVGFESIFEERGEEKDLVDFVKACAIPVATEINIFDPDLIVLGGGVLGMKGYPYGLLLDQIYESVRKPMPAKNMRIEKAIVTEDAGIKGAAYYALLRLEKI